MSDTRLRNKRKKRNKSGKAHYWLEISNTYIVHASFASGRGVCEIRGSWCDPGRSSSPPDPSRTPPTGRVSYRMDQPGSLQAGFRLVESALRSMTPKEVRDFGIGKLTGTA